MRKVWSGILASKAQLIIEGSVLRLTSMTAAILCSFGMLGACGPNGAGDAGQSDQPASAVATDNNGADSMASRDPAAGEAAQIDDADTELRPVMQAQVVLERLGFGPGVIDGKQGVSLANALKGFQEARDLPVTGELDDATRLALAKWDNIAATRIVTIPKAWGDIPFSPIPEDAAQQAEMPHLGYENLAEKLAERFHTTPEVLAQLNPGTQEPRFAPGQKLRVPNVGADRIDASLVDNKEWLETLRSLGVGTGQPDVVRILVDESEGWLKAFDAQDRLVAMFTVTTGSQNDPLPIGNWEVKGVAYNPHFAFDPKLFWDVPDSEEKQQLPPGPNGPVGVVWIDLSKDHYGIHGTPAPETIGRAQSHGCIRLTNWDAARLALMVSGSTKVVLQK
ncbi:L,D-transpeptidase family protein [Porphyrobacter sp. SLTP]|uniref:L,D-transpeptidase family protein n=1 Tax=Porphyrobacter sp. SLTP TaxID=2683266 RepID=UPI00336BD351